MIKKLLESVELFDTVIETLGNSNPRDAEILVKRYKEKATLQIIGDDFGITRERVRQILYRIEIIVLPKIIASMKKQTKTKPLTKSKK